MALIRDDLTEETFDAAYKALVTAYTGELLRENYRKESSVGELLFEVGEGGDGNGLDRRNRDCVRVARETGSQEKGADGTGGDTADEEEGFLQRVGISERFRV